ARRLRRGLRPGLGPALPSAAVHRGASELMPGFEERAECRAPPEEVWKLLYDPARFADWWAGWERVEGAPTAPSPATTPDGPTSRPGATWRRGASGGRSWSRASSPTSPTSGPSSPGSLAAGSA